MTRPARRSQQLRRSTMRKRLLEATVACLTEHGHAGASTTVICRAAGVSRGAQVHHFPTKADLLVGAVEHVFEERRAALRLAMADLPDGPDRLAAALQGMWAVVQGGPTEAWLELVVAARTDPVLRDRVVEATERLRVAAAADLQALGGLSLHPDALLLASALMDGLVVQQLAGLGDARRDRVLALLLHLATTGARHDR